MSAALRLLQACSRRLVQPPFYPKRLLQVAQLTSGLGSRIERME